MRELDEEDEPANEKLGFDLSVDEGKNRTLFVVQRRTCEYDLLPHNRDES